VIYYDISPVWQSLIWGSISTLFAPVLVEVTLSVEHFGTWNICHKNMHQVEQAKQIFVSAPINYYPSSDPLHKHLSVTSLPRYLSGSSVPLECKMIDQAQHNRR
jgi:hypothetical protein